MALKLDYVLRETGTNVRRNITLTLAAILTVAVSLALFGSSLLIRHGVSNATYQWRGDVQVIVFLDVGIPDAQREAVQRSLESDPDVKTMSYVDSEGALAEFKKLSKDTPELAESVTAAELPTSYRVTPRSADIDTVSQLKDRFENEAGVLDVVNAAETVRTMQRFTGALSVGILAVAVVLLGTAIVLIINTLRTAMFARRREIEVMKLVGATNWFIRVPFMLEGLIEGVLGALLAVGAVFGLNVLFESQIQEAEGIELLQNFVVAPGDVFSTGVIVLVLGVLIGVIGSGLAVTRFLDV